MSVGPRITGGVMPPLSGVRMPPNRPSDFGFAFLLVLVVIAVIVIVIVLL